MKRFLSAVLLLSLLLTIFSGSVNAAGQEIHSIEIKGLEEPKWGMTPDYQLELSANAHCKIDTSLNVDGYYNGVRWERWGVGPLTPTDTFENATYVLYFCLRADAGYSFSENPVLNSLYGEPGGSFLAEEGPEKGCLVVGYSFTVSTETAKLTIQVNTGGGKGTATGAGEYAIGSAVTVRAYPEMGYGFYGWSGEGDRFITSQLDYSFTITEDTILFADFTTAPFKDICGRDYYYDPVVWAVDEGITNGTGNDEFSPLETCTRGQVVTFLHRSAGSPWPHSPISPFTDVTGGEYYYDAVMWAVGSKITTGTTATTFSPNDPCTRAQVVTFIWRASGCPKPQNTNSPFTDVVPGTYYYDAVLWAVERGVTNGTSATTFEPEQTCTRGQIVTFLYRFTLPAPNDGPAPEIVYQYPSYHEHPGEKATFYVVVGGGTAPYTYEWQFTCDDFEGYTSLNGIGWAQGADTDTLTFTVDTDDFYNHFLYRCKVTDSKGKTVYSEPVYIIEPLRFAIQPNDVYCKEGEWVEFYVMASGGTMPYTFQWQYSYDSANDEWYNFTNEEWAEGYHNDTLRVLIEADDFVANYRYRCVVTDAEGTVIESIPGYPVKEP